MLFTAQLERANKTMRLDILSTLINRVGVESMKALLILLCPLGEYSKLRFKNQHF